MDPEKMNLKLLLNPCRMKIIDNKLIELSPKESIECGLKSCKQRVDKCIKIAQDNEDINELNRCKFLVNNFNNTIRTINYDIFNKYSYYKNCAIKLSKKESELSSNIDIPWLRKNENNNKKCCLENCTKDYSSELCSEDCNFKNQYLVYPEKNILCNNFKDKSECYKPDILLYGD